MSFGVLCKLGQHNSRGCCEHNSSANVYVKCPCADKIVNVELEIVEHLFENIGI